MDDIIDSMDMSLSKLGDTERQGSLACVYSMVLPRARHDRGIEQQQQFPVYSKVIQLYIFIYVYMYMYVCVYIYIYILVLV